MFRGEIFLVIITMIGQWLDVVVFCREKMCQDLRDADIDAVVILDSAVGLVQWYDESIYSTFVLVLVYLYACIS